MHYFFFAGPCCQVHASTIRRRQPFFLLEINHQLSIKIGPFSSFVNKEIMKTERYVKILYWKIKDFYALYYNLSIGEATDTPCIVCFCRSLLPGLCPDDPKTPRIQEPTIGVVYGRHPCGPSRLRGEHHLSLPQLGPPSQRFLWPHSPSVGILTSLQLKKHSAHYGRKRSTESRAATSPHP